MTPPPTQLSLLNKTLLDQLKLRHSSTKLPNQCKFAIYRQHVHIVMHVKNYIRLALFSSLSGSSFKHDGRTLSSIDVPESCSQGLDDCIWSWFRGILLFVSRKSLRIAGVIGFGVGSIIVGVIILTCQVFLPCLLLEFLLLALSSITCSFLNSIGAHACIGFIDPVYSLKH